MATLPPEDGYQQRVNSAWLSHVAKGLRGELKDDGIPEDAPDEDVIRFYRDTYAPESSEGDFQSFVTDTYGKDFKAPGPSLGERASDLGKGLVKAAPSMARQVGEQVVGEGIGKKVAAKFPAKVGPLNLGKGARVVGAPVVGGLYLARMLAQLHAGNEIEKIASSMPRPDYDSLFMHYYDQMSDGLQAKGMSLQAIAEEVNRRVKNVIHGYTMTQNSLMDDETDVSEDLLTSAAEGIANVGLFGVGSGLFKNALMAGARRAAGAKAAKAVTSTIAGRVVTHTVTGAGLGGAYGASAGALERGAHAAVEGKSVPAAAVTGAVEQGIGGAAAGALIGGPLGAALDAIGNKAVTDAVIQNPKVPEPLVETAVGKIMPQPPFEVTGPQPGVMEPPVGSQAWWDLYHGVAKPTTPLRTPLGVEGGAAAEIAPRITPVEKPMGPQALPETQPRGTVAPLELTDMPATPSEGVAPAIEPHAVSLPTAGVERIAATVRSLGGKVEGAQVAVRPSGDGTRLVIDTLKGAEHGSGVSGKALDRLVATADQQGVPMDVTVTDQRGPRGGTISAEKTAQWYEKRGFIRTTTGEGSVTLHRPVVDPNPPLSKEEVNALLQHQLGDEPGEQLDAFLERVQGLSDERALEAAGNVIEGQPMIRAIRPSERMVYGSGQPGVGMRLGGWLELQAKAADERIRTKFGRLTTGFDPTLIGDYAIKAAAKMYRLGMSAVKAITNEMSKEHPDIPADKMKEIITQAREIIQERLANDNVTIAKLARLLEQVESGKAGMEWYDKTADVVNKQFGQDGDMFLRFLAATSAGKAADANVTLALKAYGQWKLGLPFDGFIGNDMLHLQRAARGEVFGDRKLQGILAALRGDPNAVAIDRHVMRMLGFENAGKTKGSLTDSEYDFFEAVLRDLAQKQGMTARQFQAALWTASKVGQAQVAATPREMAHLHSFRPYEGIMQFEHGIHEGGKTPVQWVNEHRVTLQHLANANEGVNKTRAGEGFTYDPNDYSAYKGDKGIIVSLASVKIPTNKLSAAEIIDFTQKFKKLISTYHGMVTGTFNLEQAGEAGMTSMDLNVVLPEAMRDRAIALGKARKQHSLWDLAKSEPIETGYTGPTADAPKTPKERGQWWRKQREEIDTILREHEVPSREQVGVLEPELHRGQVEEMMRSPHRWRSIAAETLGMTEEEVNKLADEGRLRPVSDAGLINHVEVHKDGSVWEYRDPTSENGHTIMEKVADFREQATPAVLRLLEGKRVLTGHDVVQNFKSQAGFVSLKGAAKLEAFVKTNPPAKVTPALMALGGKVVRPEDYRHSRPRGVSLWIAPDGKAIEVPFHLRSADAAIKKLKLKNPVQYEGSEHDDLQVILNLGYIRVQLHEAAYAADATHPLTGAQIQALRQLRRGDGTQRNFVGRWSASNGEHRALFDEYEHGQNALNKYIDAAPEEQNNPTVVSAVRGVAPASKVMLTTLRETRARKNKRGVR